MVSSPKIVRWISKSSVSTYGDELIFDLGNRVEMTGAVHRLAREFADARFLVLPIEHGCITGLNDAIRALRNVGCYARLYLRGERSALLEAGKLVATDANIGLMLDVRDEHAPLSGFTWDRLEALCFDPDFTQRAARNFRLNMVLKTMLNLAHELGLCVFGSPERDHPPTTASAFEYHPVGLEAWSNVSRSRSAVPLHIPD